MNWQIVPQMWTSSSEGSIAQTYASSRNITRSNTGRSKSSSASGCDELAVVHQVLRWQDVQRLVDWDGHLNSRRCRTGSQWSCLNNGVICSHWRMKVTRCAYPVCHVRPLTSECLDLETLLLLCRFIFRISRSSSSVNVMGQMSRS